MGIELIWIIILIGILLFLAERTKYRIINFGSFGLILWLAFQVDDVWLMTILIFIGLIVMVYSIFSD